MNQKALLADQKAADLEHEKLKKENTTVEHRSLQDIIASMKDIKNRDKGEKLGADAFKNKYTKKVKSKAV